MIRSLILSAAVLGMVASPVFAGPAEDAFLAKLAGRYAGAGTVGGSHAGTVNCTLVIRGTREGVSYRGTCDVEAYGPQSFSGSIRYSDDARRYEATSPSGTVTAGVKTGSRITFTAKLHGLATGTSVMKLGGGHVVVDSVIDDPQSGEPITSHIDMKA